MPTITFENVRDVTPYYSCDPRVLLGVNAVPNTSYAHKANTIKDILEHSDRIAMFVDDVAYWQNGGELPPTPTIGPNLVPVPVVPAPPAPPQEVRIRLHTTRETLLVRVNDFCFGTISQIALADAQHRPRRQPYRTVHIEMDAWYFENYPLGYCVGMLCHEFGVHHLGTYILKHRGDDSLAEETAFKSGGQQGQPYGTGAPRVTPSTAGQADHAFAASPGSPRHRAYMETVIDVALAMLAKIAAGPGAHEVPVGNGDVTDLLKCYLMDVASIQATNDHRPKGLADPGKIVDCFNAHRLLLLNELADPDGQQLALLVPGPTNTGTVLKDFGYLIASMLWGLGPTWSKSWSGY